MPDRRYDQNELAAILRSAADEQTQAPSGEDTDGLTLADIQRVPSEVGIDPKFIANAAERLDRRPAKKGFHLGGTPTNEIIERNFEGELDDEAWEEIVGELRATFGCTGTPSLMGSSREWTGTTETRTVHLSARTKNGRTRYRLRLQNGGLTLAWLFVVLSTFFTLMFSGIIVKKTHASPGLVFSIGVAILVVLTLVAHFVLARWHSRKLEEVDKLMDRIEELTPRSSDVNSQQSGQTDEQIANRVKNRA